MRISDLHLANFKRFRDLDLRLSDLDCLVGPNNSGKTSILQALALFDFCLHHCLSVKNGDVELKSRSIAPDEFHVLPVADPLDLWTDRRAGESKSIRIAVTLAGAQRVTARVKLNHNRFSVAVEAENVPGGLASLRDIRVSYLPVFSTFAVREERRTPAVISGELARGNVSGIIRNLLLDLRQAGRVDDLNGVLQRAFPDMEGVSIVFDEGNDRYISVTYREHGRPREFDLASAGSGFQQFLYLFGFIALRQPTTILLDEPDVHLHGLLQRALVSEFGRLNQDGRQVLIATHSRDLISDLEPASVITLDGGAPARLAVTPDVLDLLERLGSMDHLAISRARAFGRVLVVEDESDWRILGALCATLLGESTWVQAAGRLAVCRAKTNPCRQDMTTIRRYLRQAMESDRDDLRLFVLADRDYHPDRATLLAGLPVEGIEWHVWERNEMENYLLAESALCRAILGPDPSPPAATELAEEFASLLESCRGPAQDRLVKAFYDHGRSLNQTWDPVTCSEKARAYLDQRWPSERLALADAKETVLPGIRQWAQSRNLPAPSNLVLARGLTKGEIPGEIVALAPRIRGFAGVRDPNRVTRANV
ncbi:MAG: ATP-binding protein [Planctomycetes bacterium]|nr:ATP-binding protein [Planctomycetota bacterium]